MGAFKNLIGKVFNGLTVIEQMETENNRIYWKCLCKCGNYTKVGSGHLSRTQSCGCAVQSKKPKGDGGLQCFYQQYKHSAKQRKHEFCLTKDEFSKIVLQNCFYCAAKPSSIRYNKGNSNKAGQEHTKIAVNGIDRIENDIGYLINNCVPCCSDCNYAKRAQTQTDFKTLVKRIHKNWIAKSLADRVKFKNKLRTALKL